MKKMPFHAKTATGDAFDIDFPLHDQTVDPMRVQQLISEILESIDRAIGVLGETGNGDILQAMAMATAVRAEMIYGDREVIHDLTRELVETALRASKGAKHQHATVGHA